VQYKGKNIHQILGLTVEVAHEFFKPVPLIARKLQTLLDVGLGYITLGQSATTLSGGDFDDDFFCDGSFVALQC